MFGIKNKLDHNLRYFLYNNCYKDYRVLIKYKNIKDTIIKKISTSNCTVLYTLEYSSIICAKLNRRALERIIEYPEVVYIAFDEYLFLCGMSVSTANKFHIAQKGSLSGKGIGIGLVDSGIYPHPDLLNPTNKISYFKDLINNLSYPYDDNGHGTCIAGIISSSGISSNNLYSGIAPHASLYSYKAFDALGKGFASDILFSIEDLINNSSKFNLKILCLPFELLTYNTFVIKAFNSTFSAAINKGIIPIVASGSTQNKDQSITGISTLPSCISVGGVDSTKTLKPYTYSSCGTYKKDVKPNLSAAAVNITSLNSDTSFISEKEGLKLYPSKLKTSYKAFTGTSISTAFISGVCALLLENNPILSFNDVNSLLKLACENNDLSGLGEGLINITNLNL